MQKKIATSIDVLINVDRFEHVQVTKYSEKQIEYRDEAERQQEEDKLTIEVTEDLVRSLSIMSEAIGGKTIEPTKAIVEKMRKKMYEFARN